MERGHRITGRDRVRALGQRAAAVLFWLLCWQVLSGRINNRLLLASPAETMTALLRLLGTAAFWSAVGTTFGRLVCGFLLGTLAGSLLAAAAAAFRPAEALISPLLRLMKAVPVVSFIILALLWLPSAHLSILISFLMVVPIFYTNVLQGIRGTSRELLEMAGVFGVSAGKRLHYIYLPAVLPYFLSACSVSLGFCFKSGIAAEVIGFAGGTVGEKLYEAKLYLMTGELFAWTAVIVLLSFLLEQLLLWLLRCVAACLGRGGIRTGERPDCVEEQTGADAAKKNEGGTRRTAREASPKDAAEPEECGLFEVTKGFPGQRVLENFTLTLKKDRVTVLMGPSGSGKSTAGRLLLGTLTPEKGRVRAPKRCGAVFQENRLCEEFDALTNIMLVHPDREEAGRALWETGLGELSQKPAAQLSGGMKRRVAIIRAVLSRAELLVLDEPFTGLDEETRKQMIAWIKNRIAGRWVLLITHHPEEAEAFADRRDDFLLGEPPVAAEKDGPAARRTERQEDTKCE